MSPRRNGRPSSLAFKREAADVLYRHFSQPRTTQLTPPATLVPSEPIAKPDMPATDAPPEVWIRYHTQMIAFLQWQADIEQWRGQVESRLETVEEVSRLVPEILERLGPQLLTPEHQRTVQNMAKRLHEAAGVAYPAIYAELGDHFHVAKYEQIAEARWGEVAEWFARVAGPWQADKGPLCRQLAPGRATLAAPVLCRASRWRWQRQRQRQRQSSVYPLHAALRHAGGRPGPRRPTPTGH